MTVDERIDALEKRLGEVDTRTTPPVQTLEKRVGELETSLRAAIAKGNDAWDLARFQEAEADLRWAKEQAASVAQNSAVLSGAILATSKLIAVPNKMWFFVALGAQAGICVLWEIGLHTFASSTRKRTKTLLKDVGKWKATDTLDDHTELTVGLCILVIGAAGVVALVIGAT